MLAIAAGSSTTDDVLASLLSPLDDTLDIATATLLQTIASAPLTIIPRPAILSSTPNDNNAGDDDDDVGDVVDVVNDEDDSELSATGDAAHVISASPSTMRSSLEEDEEEAALRHEIALIQQSLDSFEAELERTLALTNLKLRYVQMKAVKAAPETKILIGRTRNSRLSIRTSLSKIEAAVGSLSSNSATTTTTAATGAAGGSVARASPSKLRESNGSNSTSSSSTDTNNNDDLDQQRHEFQRQRQRSSLGQVETEIAEMRRGASERAEPPPRRAKTPGSMNDARVKRRATVLDSTTFLNILSESAPQYSPPPSPPSEDDDADALESDAVELQPQSPTYQPPYHYQLYQQQQQQQQPQQESGRKSLSPPPRPPATSIVKPLLQTNTETRTSSHRLNDLLKRTNSSTAVDLPPTPPHQAPISPTPKRTASPLLPSISTPTGTPERIRPPKLSATPSARSFSPISSPSGDARKRTRGALLAQNRSLTKQSSEAVHALGSTSPSPHSSWNRRRTMTLESYLQEMASELGATLKKPVALKTSSMFALDEEDDRMQQQRIDSQFQSLLQLLNYDSEACDRVRIESHMTSLGEHHQTNQTSHACGHVYECRSWNSSGIQDQSPSH